MHATSIIPQPLNLTTSPLQPDLLCTCSIEDRKPYGDTGTPRSRSRKGGTGWFVLDPITHSIAGRSSGDCPTVVQRGAYVDTQDADRETVLHLAVYYGHLRVTKLLLDCGADVHALNKNGKTPFELASMVAPYHQFSVQPAPGAD